MCGILVSTSTTPLTKDDLAPLLTRGPDTHQIISQNTYHFGFTRLAIMGLTDYGNQPFVYNNKVLVANAEIYNYPQLKQELSSYAFQSNSDCEILLPLYDSLGFDIFSYLDGEFAIVMYDSEKDLLLAARDPIGIRPLFYGYHQTDKKIMFASEVKALKPHVNKVYPFPPGFYYINGRFIEYSDLTKINHFHTHFFHDITHNIHDKLVYAVTKRLRSDAPLGFLLSGGLDSSLVCAIAQKHSSHPIQTFSIGMETDPIDLKYAKEVAQHLNTDHTEVRITKHDVIGALDDVIYAIESYDITTIRASIGMYLLAKYIHQNTDIKALLTGEVSDELFGYKYTDFAPNKEAFQEESIKRVKELYMYDVLRADRCLSAHSLEARVPFGDADFASYVLRINPLFKMNKYKTGKFLLRKSFAHDYLPHNILYRDKAAFSDAVGHSLVDELKRYANNLYTDQEFLKKQTLFDPIPPSKEALLYRELFEKHYPNQGHLITEYWMPNKQWVGCHVTDPSARVLSNYGKSGV
ncbi:MAG: asparagine synthase B [Candidatus Izimaplasma sp.]|nr:asparagine synthase B [Candidatus Izimaplasma bacterium]